MSKTELPDQEQRDRVVTARSNVFIPAGAGTGKTYTLVERILELVAPTDTNHEPMDIGRIAAITFTRRAAGELKTRLRSRCLKRLKDAGGHRKQQLRDTLDRLNHAFVGTIHSFADRLLRQRPVESGLSPEYQVVEDTDSLKRETFERFMAGIRNDSLADELDAGEGERVVDHSTIDRIQQAVETILRSGVPESNQDSQYGSPGLEGLVYQWIGQRDRPQPSVSESVDLQQIRQGIDEILGLIDQAPHADGPGDQFVQERIPNYLDNARRSEQPLAVFQALGELYDLAPFSKGGNYGSLSAGEFHENDNKNLFRALSGSPLQGSPADYNEHIYQPLKRWFAGRLLEARPVVIELYETVKKQRAVVDQTDLLIKLRDLLRKNKVVRQQMKTRFDHILIDEFQDTDPLQCEITFYLSERRDLDPDRCVEDWNDVECASRALTLVGDAKQSIYRFRRADIEMYAKAVNKLTEDPESVHEALETNFRSGPNLIDGFNKAFRHYLGEAEAADDITYDPKTGKAHYRPVTAHPSFEEDTGSIQCLSYNAGEMNVDDRMREEARVVADYVEWVCREESDMEVRDPHSPLDNPTWRSPSYSDVAILGKKTTHFEQYIREFHDRGIACSVSGGTTFLRDPAVKQFVLALRAVADPADGVAEAALKRPPLFSVDYGDLLAEKHEDHRAVDPPDEALSRTRGMEELMNELRKKRLTRPPLETAMDLIDRSLLGRYHASRPEGEIPLSGLYHVAAQLDHLARNQGLDYDGATEQLRGWIDSPPLLNAPAPMDVESVHLMTIYQAKGLEFPIVVAFDGLTTAPGKFRQSYTQDPENDQHVYFNLSGFDVECFGEDLEPELQQRESLKHREKLMNKNEDKRLFYVSFTRARDQLVIPWVEDENDKRYGEGASVNKGGELKYPYYDIIRHIREEDYVNITEPIDPGEQTPWGTSRDVPDEPEFSRERTEEIQSKEELARTAIQARRKRMITHTNPHEKMAERFGTEEEDYRNARHGVEFGRAVHQILERIVRSPSSKGRDGEQGIERILREQSDEVSGKDEIKNDVENTVDTLEQKGFFDDGWTLHPEYPVTVQHNGEVISGQVDFLARSDDDLWIIDYKTDPAPESSEQLTETYPQYEYQLDLYEQAMEPVAETGTIRKGLLFTENGELFEVG